LIILGFASGLIIYVMALAVVYISQNTLLYGADPTHVSPHALGLQDIDELQIQTADHETIKAWYHPAPDASPTILFCHGKGGTMATRADRFKYYVAQGWGVMFFDYRGFGGSTGKPSATGLSMDAEAAYDWLIARGVKSENLLVAGESLGTGVAITLATTRPVAAISLQAAYSSIVDIAVQRYRWAPVRWLLRDAFDMTKIIGSIRAPILFQHGDQDHTIPIGFAQRLYALAPAPKTWINHPAGGHVLGQPAWHAELNFAKRHCTRDAAP
jgi:uncharacterized protein